MPSVWWDERTILQTVHGTRGRPFLRIWLDIGTAEGRAAVDDVRLLKAALVKRGWREGEDLGYFEDPGASHGEAAWAARVEPMLTFLFR
jgi:hypothetical protein